ncbi:MAG: integral rane sensor signal transduction histidine kinase [Paenibacillus sp.]|jgi:two-component system sensor histidine kinase YesM|nr:integral rane sensor signal transduction histidine kinase [Paenibacillus sp.]
MSTWWNRFVPKRLGNRLFLAFLLLILLPLLSFQIYQYSRIESLLRREMNEKSLQQAEYMKNMLLDLRLNVFEMYVQMERSPTIQEVIRSPETMDDLTRAGNIQGWLEGRSKVIDYTRFVRVVIADDHGNVYKWNTGAEVDAQKFVQEEGFALLNESQSTWVHPNGKTMYSILRTSIDNKPIGWLKQEIDVEALLYEKSRGLLVQQLYYLMDKQGEIVATTGRLSALPEETGFVTHRLELPGTELELISKLPLDQYFGDLESLKHQALFTIAMLAVVFGVITYLTASAITRPLNLLQRRMSEVVSKQFNTHVPAAQYQGELRELADSFNGMVKDLQKAVQQLKLEERQREAIRFQMLVQQMNPHFLLNTLNTIKWNVTSKNDMETAEICIALGRLLEASLSDDADLIFLKNELELLQAYAYIQNFRYDQRFKFTIEHEEELVHTLVPKLSLQPLAENCIVHGLQFMKTGGEITIRIYRNCATLVMDVEDNGIGLEASGKLPRLSKRKGIGVANLRERLQLLYRGSASLEMIPLEQGTRIRIRMPFLYSKPYSEG